jgi:hypothetical protein
MVTVLFSGGQCIGRVRKNGSRWEWSVLTNLWQGKCRTKCEAMLEISKHYYRQLIKYENITNMIKDYGITTVNEK